MNVNINPRLKCFRLFRRDPSKLQPAIGAQLRRVGLSGGGGGELASSAQQKHLNNKVESAESSVQAKLPRLQAREILPSGFASAGVV